MVTSLGGGGGGGGQKPISTYIMHMCAFSLHLQHVDLHNTACIYILRILNMTDFILIRPSFTCKVAPDCKLSNAIPSHCHGTFILIVGVIIF